ncbi:hypothetical protein H6G64_36765 [Calothrix sp. FACHB-156]|nr:hypothetical protein [Calothrix sp. FACHB-156]
MGRSKRDAHLGSFSASKDYQEHRQRGQPHWGERWLGTACPLQGRINQHFVNQFLRTLAKVFCGTVKGLIICD